MGGSGDQRPLQCLGRFASGPAPSARISANTGFPSRSRKRAREIIAFFVSGEGAFIALLASSFPGR